MTFYKVIDVASKIRRIKKGARWGPLFDEKDNYIKTEAFASVGKALTLTLVRGLRSVPYGRQSARLGADAWRGQRSPAAPFSGRW